MNQKSEQASNFDAGECSSPIWKQNRRGILHLRNHISATCTYKCNCSCEYCVLPLAYIWGHVLSSQSTALHCTSRFSAELSQTTIQVPPAVLVIKHCFPNSYLGSHARMLRLHCFNQGSFMLLLCHIFFLALKKESLHSSSLQIHMFHIPAVTSTKVVSQHNGIHLWPFAQRIFSSLWQDPFKQLHYQGTSVFIASLKTFNAVFNPILPQLHAKS